MISLLCIIPYQTRIKFGALPMDQIDKKKIQNIAKQIATENPVKLPNPDTEDYLTLLQELHIHKIELELQNEELRNTQVQLEYNKNKFAELFNSAPVSFIVLDSGGYILEANMTFLETTGSGMENVLRKPFHDLMKTDSKKAFIGQYKSFFKNPVDRTIDVELITKNDKPLIVRLYGNRDDAASGVVPDEHLRVAAIDITAQVEAEKKQNYTIQKLLEANLKIKEQQVSIVEQERLKVVLQMAGATAHELNQPLMILLGSLDLMEMDKDDPLTRDKYLKNIRKAGERIANITKRIQSIHHDKTNAYPGGTEIIQLDQDITILYIEDDRSSFITLKKMLERQGLSNVQQAKTIKEGKTLLKKNPYDLLFIDYLLPDGDGFDILGYIQEKEIKLPIVMITGQGDEQIASKAIRHGAYDYLTKSTIDQSSLFYCVTNAIEKFRLNREIALAMQKMAEMAIKDELTGLYNRRYFNDALENEIARAGRYNNNFTLCMIDIDHFKKLNDQYGHETGDFVLTKIGSFLLKFMRKNDLSCRYRGEEFAIILPHTDIKNAQILCERFRKKIENHKFKSDSKELRITVSIGVTVFNSSSPVDMKKLVSQAASALYQAKNDGRNMTAKFG